MRRIGIFEIQKDALRFWNYLKEKGIDSSLEEESKSEMDESSNSDDDSDDNNSDF